MDLSFGWTASAFIFKQKYCTRRDWKPKHAEKFYKGREIVAIDTDRRCQGREIGKIKLTHDAVRESTQNMPESDFKKEGFAFLEKNPHLIKGSSPFHGHTSMRDFFEWWKEQDQLLWTVRYKYLEICPKYLNKIKIIDNVCREHS